MRYSDISVAIAAEHWQTLVDFYEGLFDEKPSTYFDNSYAEFRLERIKVGIFKPSDDHQPEFPSTKNSSSLCIEVVDLEEAISTIKSLGGTVSDEIVTASHGQECYAYDPAQNRIILHCSLVLN